jgi:hypothetical protein
MKDFVDTFAKAWENEHVMLGQVSQLKQKSNRWRIIPVLAYLNDCINGPLLFFFF